MYSKENYQQNKKAACEWEKIFVNDISSKGLVSKIYKELIQFDIKKKPQTTHQEKQQENGQRT